MNLVVLPVGGAGKYCVCVDENDFWIGGIDRSDMIAEANDPLAKSLRGGGARDREVRTGRGDDELAVRAHSSRSLSTFARRASRSQCGCMMSFAPAIALITLLGAIRSVCLSTTVSVSSPGVLRLSMSSISRHWSSGSVRWIHPPSVSPVPWVNESPMPVQTRVTRSGSAGVG